MFLNPVKKLKNFFNKNPENYWIFNLMTWVLGIIGVFEKIWPIILNFIGCFIFSAIVVIFVYPSYAYASHIRHNDLLQMVATTVLASLIGTFGLSRRRKK